MNQLYYGDCLTVMREYLGLGSVDLIYLDPPFNSNRSYNNIYKDETGRPLPDQIEAFCDLWTINENTERIIRTMPVLMREAGIDDKVAEFWRLWMNALRGTNERLLAYLTYMVERLLQMKPLLKPTGSIYLHCDPTASHYIKVMMDAIFGHENFRNEIVWAYKSRPQPKRTFGRKHDTILFYSKTDSYRFNWESVSRPLADTTVKKYRLVDENGRRYRLQGRGITGSPIRSAKDVDPKWEKERPDLTVRDYLDGKSGTTREDWWIDIDILNQVATERLGYATQKPLALLERIIQVSTNEGDTVLDPFCGCATTIEAAQKLKRKWIGIDVAIHAVKRVAAIRLRDRLGLVQGTDFTIAGVPRTLEGAHDLWMRDKYHFQRWVVEEVDGFVTTRRTGDGGVDGRIYFASAGLDVKGKVLESMAIEVKGGKNVGIDALRALRGVLESDTAKMAGLIVMEPLGERQERNFRRFMAEAGDLEGRNVARPYPRMQLLTVEQILAGKRFDVPGAVARGSGQPALISL